MGDNFSLPRRGSFGLSRNGEGTRDKAQRTFVDLGGIGAAWQIVTQAGRPMYPARAASYGGLVFWVHYSVNRSWAQRNTYSKRIISFGMCYTRKYVKRVLKTYGRSERDEKQPDLGRFSARFRPWESRWLLNAWMKKSPALPIISAWEAVKREFGTQR